MYASTSSGRKTADTAVSARPCYLTSVILEGDGANACTVVIYDNASAASGNVLCKVLLKATDMFAQASFNSPIEANNGLYADVTGTGAAFVVSYRPG